MRITTSQPKLAQSAIVFLGLLLGILFIFIASPTDSTRSVWRYLAFSGLITGIGYVFFVRNVSVAVFGSIAFAALFEGPLKYLTDNRSEAILAYLGRDLLLYTAVLSLLLYLLVNRELPRTRSLPPLIILFIFFGLNLFVQWFNPAANSPLASFINSRIIWEMIPLYFMGYYYLNSLNNWRTLFLTLSVVAAINGAVATYQSYIGPAAVASWGPGYQRQIYEVRNTTITEDGSETFRPMALGSDMGFSGAVGLAAVPMIVALLNQRRKDKQGLGSPEQWALGILLYVLALGIAVAVYASGSRSSLVMGIVALVITLIGLAPSVSKGRFLAVLGLVSMLSLVGFQSLSVVAPYLGLRYGSIESPEKLIQTIFEENRQVAVTSIPVDLAQRYPLGGGLDNIGFGAQLAAQIANTYTRPQPENTENNLNLSLLGLGIPGTLVWVLLHLAFIIRGLQVQKQVLDLELRTYLLAAVIILLTFLLYWFIGNLTVFPQNLLFWLLPGMIFGTVARIQEEAKNRKVP